MNLASSPEPNPEEPEAVSPFQSLLSEEEQAPQRTEWSSAFERILADIPEAPDTFGEMEPRFPDQMAAEFSQQGYGDTCAIRCQEVILHKYGVDVDENTLVHQAISEHLYYPGQATLPEDVGKLLEDYGIHVHQYEHASIFNLTVELAQGHEVMIGVNSNELQHPLLLEMADALHVGTADHAVIVSGIDTHDLDRVQVIVSDPSTGEAAARYPLESFVSAWQGSDFFMTATNEPPPQNLHLPEMEHFDYESGHLEEIAGVPYKEFLHYVHAPEEAAHVLEVYAEQEQSEHEEHSSLELSDLNEGNHLDHTSSDDGLHELEESIQEPGDGDTSLDDGGELNDDTLDMGP